MENLVRVGIGVLIFKDNQILLGKRKNSYVKNLIKQKKLEELINGLYRQNFFLKNQIP